MKCFPLILVALSVVVSPQADAETLKTLIARVTPSVVGVGVAYPARSAIGKRAPRRLLGTGFIVSHGNRTLVVTNAHVVPQELDTERLESLAVFSGSGNLARQHPAALVKLDLVHDLAVLSYTGPVLPAMTLADSAKVMPGERVAFTGFPIGAVLGLYPVTHEGIVSAITPIARAVDRGRELSAVNVKRLRSPFDVYQLDAIAYPGNSGSAVYSTESGKVVGVMNAVFVKESRETLLSKPSGIAYAIPIAHLRDLLDGL